LVLEEVRSSLDRVEPADLASEVAAGALVIDTRPLEQRQRDGELSGALIIDRNVLEWRLDPTCPHHIAEADSADQRMIIVCDEGYSSSWRPHRCANSASNAPPICLADSKPGNDSALRAKWMRWRVDPMAPGLCSHT
jgi:hypothetical protein